MTTFLVTVEGTSREVYAVQADDADDARRRWADGRLVVSEVEPDGVIDVQQDA